MVNIIPPCRDCGEEYASLDDPGGHWLLDHEYVPENLEPWTRDNSQGCARCEGGPDHAALKVYRFAKPIRDRDGTWRYWATCPRTGDPIIIGSTVEARRA